MNGAVVDMTTGDRAPPRVLVMGGGTGISACLEGIKDHPCDITAIVTVADDGGSSGRLRKDYHMLPPGDIRNCLVALSGGDPLLAKLFNYRFPDSILRGHSFGNLLLAVLTNLTGDFRAAVNRAGHLLSVRGRVLPSTDTRVVLVAIHPDGTRSTGEQCISRCRKPIIGMQLRPEPPPVSAEIRDLIEAADLVVIGPGSLFTSLIPNLLIPGMTDAIARTRGRVILVANLMTQPGETDGFTIEDHVRILRTVGGLSRLDLVLCSTTPIPEEIAARYRAAGAALIGVPSGGCLVDGVRAEVADLSIITGEERVRHDPARLAEVLRGLVDSVRSREEARE